MTSKPKLTHLDEAGNPRMVDIKAKPITTRRAVASGVMTASNEVLTAVQTNSHKGSVTATATIAAIQAAKRTSELIPLCHGINLDSVAVKFKVDKRNKQLTCIVEAISTGRTGVEMEALTAVHVSLLTVYDMCKAIDRSMEVTSIKLIAKSGGKSDFG